MQESDRERLIDFLGRKMCGPCGRGDLRPEHEACVEAAELIAIVRADAE